MAAGWKDCTRTRPCPLCVDIGRGKSHQRCAYTEDGAHHCFRTAGQPVPGWRIITPMAAHGGTIYRRSDDERVRRELTAEEIDKQRLQEEAEWVAKVNRARVLWERGVVGHPVAAAYFANRLGKGGGEAEGRLPESIRFVEDCTFYDGVSGKSGPAVLAGMTNARGEITACHRIYIEAGSQPPVKRKKTDAPKQMLGKPMGSGVRFPALGGALGDVGAGGTRVVVVCEGVETGRALNIATGWHVIAGFSGAGMIALELDSRESLADVVIVAGDFDAVAEMTGQRPGAQYAAIAANTIWSKNPALKAVEVCIPSHASVPEAIDLDGAVLCGTKGVDWEDVLRMWGAERVARVMREAVREGLAKSEKGVRAPVAVEVAGVGGGNGTDGTDGTDGAVLPKGDLARARAMIESRYMFGRGCERFTVTYDYADKQWYVYVGTHWEARSDEEMRSSVLQWCEPYHERLDDGRVKPVGLTAKAAENIAKAVQADAGVRVEQIPTWVPATIDAKLRPLWQSSRDEWGAPCVDPKVVIPLRDGLLNVDAWLGGEVRLLAHTPRYLTKARPSLTLDVEALAAYLKDDPKCEDRGGKLVAKLAPTWMKVIEFASDGDPVWQECLGRAFGISMTPDTSMERIFFMEGPPGSSKGTIFEGLVSMLGEDLVATSSLTDICEKFEAAAWRGRRVVGMTDASVGRYTDAGHAVETLKRISGGDPIPSEQKYIRKNPFWRPDVHLWIVTNDLLKLPDPSLSLMRRLVAMPTVKAVGDKQDPRVKERIKQEGAGILVWALCHLKALMEDRAAGRNPFIVPEVGKQAVNLFARNSAPVAAFVQDCCRLDPTASVTCDVLYDVFATWSKGEGTSSPMAKEKFGVALRALVPGLEHKRVTLPGMRAEDGRKWVYTGVRPLLLGEQEETPLTRRGEFVSHMNLVAARLCPRREYGDGPGQFDLPV